MPRESHRDDTRILFVEDNPLDIELCRLHLERDGLRFEWRAAASEASVRLALREFEPDIVLCDYSMPGFSGRHALELIHKADPRLPVLVLSGTITEDMAVDCLRAGASDCLAKHALARVAPAVRRALGEVEARRRYEARLQRLATHDQLTGLPNSGLLGERVTRAIGHAHASGKTVALIALDIDGFGVLNQGFGRTAGNLVLKAVGATLRSVLPSRSTVARIGNDEFAVLLPSVEANHD